MGKGYLQSGVTKSLESWIPHLSMNIILCWPKSSFWLFCNMVWKPDFSADTVNKMLCMRAANNHELRDFLAPGPM